jgi:hypothetical protein
MRVVVSGASGLIGLRLVERLRTEGARVLVLVRRRPGAAGEIGWDPARGALDGAALEGVGAVVHLAGANIAAGRWTAARKREIRDSRVLGTRLLCERLAGLREKPRVLVSASAVGYYGDRGDEELTEASPAGEGFLPDVCREWEAATEAAAAAGIRVVNLRMGVVLSRAGGALAWMVTPFRLGLGGPIGSGRQFLSWIALDDVVRVIRHVMDDASLSGPVNAVAPAAVTSGEFSRVLGRVLRRPAVLRVPAVAVRVILGELGQALLLEGQRVVPRRLLVAGFSFRHSDLASALRAELGVGLTGAADAT